ncbi:hypothetical protein GCK32_018631 [Trichostrongylus colubriformis]|uniref:Uncharacterized protein n=1 Tax=Trichostrongylus colubriformis TaxID=6319 RepID=A0AAN8G0C8_TRICO
MERNSAFYLSMIIAPSFVINVLSIVGVFLKSADSMGKLGMALTNIMSLTFVLGILATALPKTEKLPKMVSTQKKNALYAVPDLPHTTSKNRQIRRKNYIPEENKGMCIYVVMNLSIMVVALLIVLALPYASRTILTRFEIGEDCKEEKRKRKEEKTYVIVRFGLFVLMELANLINLLVLVV